MQNNIVEEIFDIGDIDERFYAIVGRADENLKKFTELFDIKIVARGQELYIKGESSKVGSFLEFLNYTTKEYAKSPLSSNDVLNMAISYTHQQTDENQIPQIDYETILITHRKKAITPKTKNQSLYVNSIKQNDIVFGIGPAGTGKTYLAMAMAVSYLKAQKINKIILTRPAVEAGEKLGFLPGSIAEKVDPYLRPLYDALFDMIDYEKSAYLLEKNVIEIAPLAFMRGRTLNDAFIILDEAQNSTKEQMKMFLTRIGFGSKAVITGDMTQVDLPRKDQSGLREAIHVLKNIKGIDFTFFDEKDVVRHPIVQKIVKAYEAYEQDISQDKQES
jgi:phosphate starvation-inducible PhoH-like protein